MEIRQLEAFNAVVTTGSVTAAGRLLGRSQPVVSRQISDLEAELGFVLFERTRPAITLTESGGEFYQEVRGVLADLQQLDARVLGMRSGQVRPLRVLATTDLAHGLFPEALAQIDRFNPVFRQKLILEEIIHEATQREIQACRADFALINLPIDTEGLHVHWCGQAPCLLALPAAHPLAGHDALQLEDVRDTDIITLLTRYGMRYYLINSLIQATANGVRRHLEVASQQTALSMVRAGLGVALLDPFSIRGALLDGVVVRPLLSGIQYRIGVVSQQAHALPEGAQRLINGLYGHVRTVVPLFVDTDVNGLPQPARPAARACSSLRSV
ncbi:LysR family transcriptional regulator [Castellaniella caeni]|uniref:LysR family transcriptional regulator n=1 Tax=Castellaniella caeni TaxID=266123 RepID=UPI0008295FF6|nr:LysR family transcriptional regulator [Castellaniella caeni]